MDDFGEVVEYVIVGVGVGGGFVGLELFDFFLLVCWVGLVLYMCMFGFIFWF